MPVRVVISLVKSLERSSVATATSKRHVTVVQKRADDVTGVVVGQHENETTARIGPEVDVQSSPTAEKLTEINSITCTLCANCYDQGQLSLPSLRGK